MEKKRKEEKNIKSIIRYY